MTPTSAPPAYLLGFAARKARTPRAACPYGADELGARGQWLAGWDACEEYERGIGRGMGV